MESWGFKRGIYNPCIYRSPRTKLNTLLYGDDFVRLGNRKCARGGEDKQQGIMFYKIIRVTEDGWEYEADQGHAGLIVEDLGLKEARSVGTPGEDEKQWGSEENKEELNPKEAIKFRAIAVRANYLSSDRPDIAYNIKEICRCVSEPTVGAMKMLKRLG
eukprot:5168187-Heterocapsa_arctica.AAC.1